MKTFNLMLAVPERAASLSSFTAASANFLCHERITSGLTKSNGITGCGNNGLLKTVRAASAGLTKTCKLTTLTPPRSWITKYGVGPEPAAQQNCSSVRFCANRATFKKPANRFKNLFLTARIADMPVTGADAASVPLLNANTQETGGQKLEDIKKFSGRNSDAGEPRTTLSRYSFIKHRPAPQFDAVLPCLSASRQAKNMGGMRGGARQIRIVTANITVSRAILRQRCRLENGNSRHGELSPLALCFGHAPPLSGVAQSRANDLPENPARIFLVSRLTHTPSGRGATFMPVGPSRKAGLRFLLLLTA